MHDYRDLVSAGFAVLCAALMLIAGLLFILSAADEPRLGTEKELPSKGTHPPVLSESSKVGTSNDKALAGSR
jgi:hypothetical protein